MKNTQPKLYLGSDHAGYKLKEEMKPYLQELGYSFVDLGSFNEESVDYPDIAREVCEKVLENKASFGILICGTGVGVMMAANKHPGIRAVVCTHELMAIMARKHNDANVLCLGSRIIGSELSRSIIKAFLETTFEREERHVRRVGKIESQLDGKQNSIRESD